MKCPVCKGKKYIQEFDSRGLRQYTCRKCGGMGEVDKIKEKFERICTDNISVDGRGNVLKPRTILELLTAGYNAADLLPTEKVCPACGDWTETLACPECGNIESLYHDEIADGYRVCSNKNCKQEYYIDVNYCTNCKGKKVIQIYYTPEQYEKIMGKPYPDDVLVWGKYLQEYIWDYFPYKDVKNRYNEELLIVIVQTAQPAPPADYRIEE